MWELKAIHGLFIVEANTRKVRVRDLRNGKTYAEQEDSEEGRKRAEWVAADLYQCGKEYQRQLFMRPRTWKE